MNLCIGVKYIVHTQPVQHVLRTVHILYFQRRNIQTATELADIPLLQVLRNNRDDQIQQRLKFLAIVCVLVHDNGRSLGYFQGLGKSMSGHIVAQVTSGMVLPDSGCVQLSPYGPSPIFCIET